VPDSEWGVLATLGVVALLLFIVSFVVVLGLLIKMIRNHRLVHQPGMPVSSKISYYVSLVYAIFPFDVLPDPILADDIVVLLGALLYVSHAAKKVRRSLVRRRD
jgi:uncharacterized membrane protein YkvA (DUF1232 family)